jgi:SAM-dependent methyltransferase
MAMGEEHPSNPGYCVICERDTVFIETDSWLRDHYLCERCKSIPRNRALVNALNVFCPAWKSLAMHESSPSGPLSAYLKASGKHYTASHYYSDVPRGHYKDGIRSEDLSRLTLANSSFDLFITSDVFEHVIEPEAAFSEIARVLKPGGMHVFTMPLYSHLEKSLQRAKLVGDDIVTLEEPVYHGNPLTPEGSLVTFDWGRDFPLVVYEASSLVTAVLLVKDRNLGLDGQFLEVFISRKMPGKPGERLEGTTPNRRWWDRRS